MNASDIELTRSLLVKLKSKLNNLQKKVDENKGFENLFSKKNDDILKLQRDIWLMGTKQDIIAVGTKDFKLEQRYFEKNINELSLRFTKIINVYKLIHKSIYNYNIDGIDYYIKIIVAIESFLNECESYGFRDEPSKNIELIETEIINFSKFEQLKGKKLKEEMEHNLNTIRLECRDIPIYFKGIEEGLITEILRVLNLNPPDNLILNKKRYNWHQVALLNKNIGENTKIGCGPIFDTWLKFKPRKGFDWFRDARNLTMHDRYSGKIIINFPEIIVEKSSRSGFRNFLLHIHKPIIKTKPLTFTTHKIKLDLHYLGVNLDPFKKLISELSIDLDESNNMYDIAKSEIMTTIEKPDATEGNLFDILINELNYLKEFIQFSLFGYLANMLRIKNENSDEFKKLVDNTNLMASQILETKCPSCKGIEKTRKKTGKLVCDECGESVKSKKDLSEREIGKRIDKFEKELVA